MLEDDSQIHTAAREHEEEPSQTHQRLSSRHTFLSGSAKLLGGGALALGLGAAPALAKGNSDEDEDKKKQGGKATNGSVSDVDILNYALVLERLEYEFYRRHLQRFSKRSKAPPSSTGLASRFAAKSMRTSCASATMRRPTCRLSSRS